MSLPWLVVDWSEQLTGSLRLCLTPASRIWHVSGTWQKWLHADGKWVFVQRHLTVVFLKNVIVHEAHTSARKDEKRRCIVSTAETLNSVNLTRLTWCQATWHARFLYSKNSLVPSFSQLTCCLNILDICKSTMIAVCKKCALKHWIKEG